MDNLDIVKEFFSNMRCTQCHSLFDEDSIRILRQENNYTVIRVICKVCNKNIGLAIMGLDKIGMQESIEQAEEHDDLPFETNEEPITFDDVINAHNFIYSLGSDWSKHLPNISKDSEDQA